MALANSLTEPEMPLAAMVPMVCVIWVGHSKCMVLPAVKKWVILMLHWTTMPRAEARAAPPIPHPKGKTNRMSRTTFNAPPVITAAIARFGSPSARTRMERKLEKMAKGKKSTI